MSGAAPAEELVHQLGRALAEANACLERLMAQEGVTGLVPSHGDILAALFSAEPASMQQLAQACSRDPSTVTALVKKLEREGYVSVEQSPADGRSKQVRLTQRGRALRPKFERISVRLREAQSRGVSAADLETAARVLGTMQGNFKEECR